MWHNFDSAVSCKDVEGDGGWESIVASSKTLLFSSLDDCIGVALCCS